MEFIEKVIVMEQEEKKAQTFDDTEKYVCDNMFEMIASSRQEVESFRVTKVSTKEDVAVILMSSGTTGLPKGVVLSYQAVSALIANE